MTFFAALQSVPEPSAQSAGETLTTLLTAEGLVLVATGLSVTFASGSTFGTKWLISPRWLAVISTTILIALAVGAGFSWSDAWAGCQWPAEFSQQAAAVALAIGVATPPILSLLVTINVWR